MPDPVRYVLDESRIPARWYNRACAALLVTRDVHRQRRPRRLPSSTS